MNTKLLGWVLVACVVSAHAGEPQSIERQPKEIVVQLEASAEIGADGMVKALTWDEKRPVGRLFIEKVDPVVRRWQFVAGQVGGRPADTQTSLKLSVQGSARPDGTLKLRVLDASTGARARKVVTPKYPPQAYRVGASALVTIIVTVDPSGKVHAGSEEFQGDGGYRLQFTQAANRALEQSDFRLERVAGQPVAARMRYTVNFCLSDTYCRYQHPDNRKVVDQPDTLVALDSAVRLITNVSDLEL